MAEQGTAAIPWGVLESRYAHVERVIHGKRGSGWRVVKHKTSGGSLIIATDVFKTRSQAESHLREEYDGADASSKAEGPPLRKGWPGEEEARKTEKVAGIHSVTGLMQAEMTFRPPPVSQQIGWSPGRSKYLCVETVVDSKGVSTFFVNYPHSSLSSSASADSAEQVEEPLYESSFADRTRADEAVEAYCKKKKIELSQLVRTGYPGRDAARAQEEAAQIQPRTGQWQAVSMRSKHPLVMHDLATTGTKVAGTAPHTAKPSMKRAHSEMSSAGPAEGEAASAAEGGGTTASAATADAAGESSATPSGPPAKTPRTEKGEKAPSATGGNYHMSADGLFYWWFARPRGRPSNDLLARERDLIRQIEAGEVQASSVGAVKKPLKKAPGLLNTSALFSALHGSGADQGGYRLEGSGDHLLLEASVAAASASGASGAAAGAEGGLTSLGQGTASTPALALMRAQAGTGVPSASSSSSGALANASSAAPSAAASAGAANGLVPQIARVAAASKIQPGKLKFSVGEPIDANALLHGPIPPEEALVALTQDAACSALFTAGSFEGQKIGEELVVIRRAEALRSEFSKRSDTASATQMQQVVNSRTAALQKYMLSRVGAAAGAGAGGMGSVNPQAVLMAQLVLQRQQQQQQHQQQLILAANLANANLASALAAVGGPSSFSSLAGMQGGGLLGPMASTSQVPDTSASSLMGSASMSQATAASLLGALPAGLSTATDSGVSTGGLSTGLVMPSELTAADAPPHAEGPQLTDTVTLQPPA